MARRGALSSNSTPSFILRAASAREAQTWLAVMRESPLMGSLASLHQVLDEEGELTVQEFRVNMPPKREFIFADASSIFESATDILIRNVPARGSSMSIILACGGNKPSQFTGSAIFEPSISDSSGDVTIALAEGVTSTVSWSRKYPSHRRKIVISAAVFVVIAIVSLIVTRAFRLSLVMGVLCSVGTAYMLVKQDQLVNDVVITGVNIHKPNSTSSPKGSAGKKSLVKGGGKGGKYVATDPHITSEEAWMIEELRERLKDMWNIPSDADAFIKKHEKFLREWHADLNAIKNVDKIKFVMDKHILEDFRLVRYLRARKHKLDKAEVMARDSLLWRVALGSDTIHEDKDLGTPPEWICRYFGSKHILTMLRPTEDSDIRLEKFFLRDKEGHLGLFFRAGRMNSRKIFKKMSSKPCYMIKMVIWTTELLRRDLEQWRLKNKDKPETVLSVIVDLEGFAISDQLPLGDLIPLARRFFPIFATGYPELLNRVLVFNAPWLFGSLWTAVKPFIPEEVQEKIQIHSGAINYEKHIQPYFADDVVPKYFGGNMIDKDDGNEFCLDRVAPYGPYGLPNEGFELLEGTDAKGVTW
jgi:hypothetical protein